MYSIDLILRGNPVGLSVQRKEKADAEELYKQIRDAMSHSRLLELTCEKQADKKLAVMSSDVIAVQMNSGKNSGRPIGMGTGFFSVGSEDS